MPNNSEANACEKCPKCGAAAVWHDPGDETGVRDTGFECSSTFGEILDHGDEPIPRGRQSAQCRIRELTTRAEQAERKVEELRGVLESLKSDSQSTLDLYDRLGPTATFGDRQYYSATYVLDSANERLEKITAALAALEPRNGREGE